MQASLGNVVKAMGDNEDVHFEDTVRGSDWGADQRVVRMFVDTAPKAVRELAAWGVPWSRVQKGDRRGDHQRPEGHDHRARRSARAGDATRLRWYQEMARLLRFRRHRPRHAVRDERPGNRPRDHRARAHGGDGADPRWMPLLRRGGTQPRDRGTGRLRRQGDRHCQRRRGTALSRDDQRGDLRGHRHGAGVGDRRGSGGQHGGDPVSPDRRSFRRAFWSPKAAAATADCCATLPASASCPTTSRRRRNSPRATSYRGAWRSTSARGRGREVALR